MSGNYTEKEKIMLLVAFLVSMRDSCPPAPPGTGLGHLIDSTLWEVAPLEAAEAELKAYGDAKPPRMQ